jgi:ComEC/Rec2-related protein
VRILFLWLVAALVSAGAYCWARASDPGYAPLFAGAISTVVAVAIATMVIAAARAACGRATSWAVPIIVLALCVVRGLSAGVVAAEPPMLVADRRGPARGLVRLVVVGASTPGSSCHLSVRSPTGGTAFDLLAPTDSCPLGHGDEIRVPATDMTLEVAVLSDGPPRLLTSRVYLERRADEIYWHALARMRQWGWDVSRGDPARAFVIASSFGLVSAIPPDVREDVRRAGLGHLIAVSGMHVGVLALVVQRLLRRALAPLGVGPRASILLSWIPVAAYVIATGCAAPAVRAAAMLAVVGVGSLIGRPTHGLTVLAMAATVMLVACPQWAIDPGFHLSVAAMAALVRLPGDAGLVRSAWQLHWAVLPVAMLHFGPSGAGGVLANLVALPIFTVWVLPLTAVGVVGIPLYGAAAFDPAAAGADLVLLVSDHVAQWPVVPAWMLAIAAGVALLARLLPSRPWRDAIVPPFLAAVGVLLAVAVDRPAVATAPRAEWYAFGSRRQPTVVTIVGDRVACVQDPSGNAKRWSEKLDALGIDRVVAIAWTGRAPERGGDPPHVVELATELARAGRFEAAEHECRYPDEARVRKATTTCARLHDGAQGAVAVEGERAFCWLRGTWLPVAIDWE